jgi:hypothetical protein
MRLLIGRAREVCQLVNFGNFSDACESVGWNVTRRDVLETHRLSELPTTSRADWDWFRKVNKS